MADRFGAQKLASVVTDNAAAMLAACRLLRGAIPTAASYGCASHSANLLANDIIEIPALHSAMEACKTIALFFKRKTPFAVLNRIAGKVVSFSMPCDTRWSSYLALSLSLLKARRPIAQAIHSVEIAEFPNKKFIQAAESVAFFVNDRDFWQRVQFIATVLAPITKVIDLAQSDFSFLSEVPQAVMVAEKAIRSATGDAQEAVLVEAGKLVMKLVKVCWYCGYYVCLWE